MRKTVLTATAAAFLAWSVPVWAQTAPSPPITPGAGAPPVTSATPPVRTDGTAVRPERTWTASDRALLGADIVTADGEELGEIENLVIGSDGQVKAVVVAWGGFLGLGERRAALTFDQLQFRADSDDVVVALTQEQIRAMPAYDEDNLAQFASGGVRAVR